MNSIRDIIRSHIKNTGLERRLLEKMIFTDWYRIAGDKVFRNTRPAFIRSGMLFVEVPDSVWAHSLTFFKPELIAKINSYLGSPVVKDIRFRTGMAKGAISSCMMQEKDESIDEAELEAIGNLFSGLALDKCLKDKLTHIVYWQKTHRQKKQKLKL